MQYTIFLSSGTSAAGSENYGTTAKATSIDVVTNRVTGFEKCTCESTFKNHPKCKRHGAKALKNISVSGSDNAR